MSNHSEIQRFYTKSGLKRYQIEIWHTQLNKHQIMRSDDKYVLTTKAQLRMQQWDDMWRKKRAAEQNKLERQRRATDIQKKKVLAANMTSEAQELIESMQGILDHTLSIDDTINWELLKINNDFSIPKPKKRVVSPPRYQEIPIDPDPSEAKYNPKFGLLDKLSKFRREQMKNKAKEQFRKDMAKWEETKNEIVQQNQRLKFEYEKNMKKYETDYLTELDQWKRKKEVFLINQQESNQIIENKKKMYFQCAPEAILDYCDMVLSNSQYPSNFPQEYELDYNPETKILVVDYQLPPLEAIPTLKEVKYIQSIDEFTEKHLPKTQINKIYDSVLYQVTLRTIHELFEADAANALDAINFNGYVKSIDPATGKETNACVLSVQAKKDDFEEINLEMVEPKACFKKLKGVGSSKLHSLTPIAPIMRIERDDKRFTDSYDVIEGIEEGDNLAAMDWEDFEHLIRELFEEAFSEAGAEVRVTQASRDGGIDAVIFDPDPLRGGKIVVQAKRYTNVVGVSAVRDLYGTLLNEGANKGILVTTSDYGPDAYKFAEGKPLQLLNGGNLLHLLEQHGHKARIDLKEAKETLYSNPKL